MMHSRTLFRPIVALLFFLCVSPSVFAQTRTISGRVVDAQSGQPMAGVTVRVKEVSGVGTTTNAQGHYQLSVPAEARTLIFSFVGYQNQEQPITGNEINVSLQPGEALQEVVVVGYGTQRAQDVSAAISSISNKDFNKGIVTNPMQQIQGKVAGLVITQPGGDPNQNVIIRLRGQTSITGGQTPLIVVDGVPLDDPSQIANIPPGDIESYDVLKDASATAIYGSRGANGVIIINTKKGQAGQTRVTYNGYVGLDWQAKYYDLLNANEWRTATQQLGIYQQSLDKGANTNWQKAITQTAFSHAHNLMISGGTDKFTYSAAGNYINQQGIVINSGKNEIGLRFNAQQKALNDKLTLNYGLLSTRTNRKYVDYSIFTYVFSTPPTYPVYNPDGSYFGFFDFEQQNPVAQQMLQLNRGSENLNIYSAGADYELFTGFKVGLLGSLSYFNKQTDFFQPTLPGVGNINNGAKYSENRNSKKGNIHIEYTHTWNNVHNFDFTGVYEYNNFLYDNFRAAGQQYLVQDNQDNALQNGNTAFNQISSYKEEYTLISFLGRVTYNYRGKYYIDASFRRDGSSKFGVNNRWGNFPAVSAAWRISEEGFMRNVSWINDLKIKIGYGVTGNQDAITPYATQLLVGSIGRYYNPVNPAYAYPQSYAPTQNANPDLKWEERHGFNVGLNFSLFNDRLGGDVNVFNDKTKNLLYYYTVPVPPFYVNTILANVGSLTNKGVEISLNGTIIKGNKFNWTANGQITFIKTRVTSLSGTYAGYKLSTDNIPGGYAEGRGLSSNPITYLKVGYSPYVFYLPHWEGVDANGNQLFDSAGVKIPNYGNATFRYIDPAPKFNYGLGSTLSYGNWSLNFFFRGVYGQKIFNNTLLDVEFVKRLPGNNVTKEALTNGIKDAAVASDHWLENASYLRLDNISLSYSFKQVKGIGSIDLYVTANNVFVITPYRGLDPEIRNADTNEAYIDANYGSDGYYPRTRSIVFGVNVSFK
jgi:TonB-linked SusC/RagA family outer membrane protein